MGRCFMTPKMTAVTIHIDETLDRVRLEKLRDTLLSERGVMAADYRQENPHLMVVEYDPDSISSNVLLKTVEAQGVHAELIGL